MIATTVQPLDVLECDTLSTSELDERRGSYQATEQLIAIQCDADRFLVPSFQANSTARYINYRMGASEQPLLVLRAWRTPSCHLGGRTPLQVLPHLTPAEMLKFAEDHMIGH